LPILENIAIRNNQLFVTNLEYTFVLNNPGLENNIFVINILQPVSITLPLNLDKFLIA